jgi:3-oxoacyl-[acyl-carrier-protein] synthase II
MPPTNIDPHKYEFDFGLVTQPGGLSRPLKYVQHNSFGFGGNNAISIFKAISP